MADSVASKPGRRAFWFSASPLSVICETLAIMTAVSLVALALTARNTTQPLHAYPIVVAYPLIFLDGPFCAIWCAARLRVGEESWRRWAPLEVGIGALISLVPSAIMVVALVSLIVLNHINPTQLHRGMPYYAYGIGIASVVLVALTVEFFVFRVLARLWLAWNRLRRQHLSLALTHALLVVAASGAGFFSLIFISLFLFVAHGDRPTLAGLVSITYVMLVISAIAILCILPPSALFSYLFARGVTQRLHILTTATDALRAGDYSVRLEARGADEVAQLQTNFNAMATDLERAMRDLKAERDTVATLLSERRELMASVSHELRTPVATMRSYLESSLAHWNDDQAPPPTLRHDIVVMEQETIRLQSLIDDLFALARADVGRLDLRIAPTNIGTLVKRIAEADGPLAWKVNRVEITTEMTPTLPYGLVDGARLEQVIRNLLRNSLRHTQPGGIVSLAVCATDDALLVQVRDTGDGIAPADLPRIWDRFYQGERSREESGGAGLGLALVKELTEAMGGTVAVESEPGNGSRFTLSLPRATEPLPWEAELTDDGLLSAPSASPLSSPIH